MFEHLHDPARAFGESARLLRPGGSLIVQVPNLRSIHGRLAPLEDVPRHLYFFSPWSSRGLWARAGSIRRPRGARDASLSGASGREALRTGPHGPSASRLAILPDLPDSSRGTISSLAVHQRRSHRDGTSGSVLIPDWLVRAARISGQIVVVFKKPELYRLADQADRPAIKSRATRSYERRSSFWRAISFRDRRRCSSAAVSHRVRRGGSSGSAIRSLPAARDARRWALASTRTGKPVPMDCWIEMAALSHIPTSAAQ